MRNINHLKILLLKRDFSRTKESRFVCCSVNVAARKFEMTDLFQPLSPGYIPATRSLHSSHKVITAQRERCLPSPSRRSDAHQACWEPLHSVPSMVLVIYTEWVATKLRPLSLMFFMSPCPLPDYSVARLHDQLLLQRSQLHPPPSPHPYLTSLLLHLLNTDGQDSLISTPLSFSR